VANTYVHSFYSLHKCEPISYFRPKNNVSCFWGFTSLKPEGQNTTGMPVDECFDSEHSSELATSEACLFKKRIEYHVHARGSLLSSSINRNIVALLKQGILAFSS